MAFFPYEFEDRYAFMWKLMGARPDSDGVEVTDDGRFIATYGRRRLETPVSNIDDAHITEHYKWYKAIGTRLSFADDGLTFGTNTQRGVCVHFADRVPKVIGFRDHSALTVTVGDAEGLVAALKAATDDDGGSDD